ncbi:MAG: YjbH domain-containing protein [Pseudoflavonifractor sp.]|nr:YjbH domain-containing protein [Alloprevotella sp.]MCM1116583.1 YjbH domain-containing protein [Pseudoflavonifractor sp.]
MSGLINVPSADMDSAGDARIGAHFLNRYSLPTGSFAYPDGKPYHSYDFYLSITPFRWMELGYTFTLFRALNSHGVYAYNRKDRYFSVKFAPFRESKLLPAIAVGANDFIDSSFKIDDPGGSGFFCNFYLAATKHIPLGSHGGVVGVSAVYRHFTHKCSRKWDGLVGGLTYSPPFAPSLRFIAEWTGCDVNVGADCLLFRHLLIQASLQDGKFPSAGLCYVVNLF